MSGKHFSVKGDLKPSLIDHATDLKHIRVRRGPDVAFWKTILERGTTGPASGAFSILRTKENIMIRKTTYKDNLNRLRHAVCAFGLLISLAALPAFGQQIHQLSYNNSNWADQNLLGAQTDPNTGIAAFVTTPNDGPHSYYLASNDHVHQLFFNGVSWSDEDLTTETGAPAAIAKSAVAGFSVQNFQYVYNIGSDQHLHQLLYNNSAWADSDLTAITGGPLSSTATQLVAFTTGSPAVHVYYMASDGHIHQTFNTTGSNWQDQDLTALSGGPSSNGVWMAGFNIANFQYVYYVANTGHVHQLLYNNSSWADEDLTALTATPSVAPGSGVAALVIPGSKKLRVYLIANNDHVLQLSSTNNHVWTSADLTKKTKGPLADAANGIAGFATTPNNQLHIFYVSGNHVNQLFLPTPATKWQNEDLTVLTNGGAANGISGIAGFSLQNFQYVYYAAN
jgi:hypothetical protein